MNLLNLKRDEKGGALYLRFREGMEDRSPDRLPEPLIEESLELAEGVYLDITEDGLVIGLEFVTLSDFEAFLNEHPEGVDIPERIEDPAAFHLHPA